MSNEDNGTLTVDVELNMAKEVEGTLTMISSAYHEDENGDGTLSLKVKTELNEDSLRIVIAELQDAFVRQFGEVEVPES